MAKMKAELTKMKHAAEEFKVTLEATEKELRVTMDDKGHALDQRDKLQIELDNASDQVMEVELETAKEELGKVKAKLKVQGTKVKLQLKFCSLLNKSENLKLLWYVNRAKRMQAREAAEEEEARHDVPERETDDLKTQMETAGALKALGVSASKIPLLY